MRILHLIDAGSNDGVPCAMRLLADAARRADWGRHRILAIGAARDVEGAQRCGVEVDGWVCPPRSAPWAARSALIGCFKELELAFGPFDLIHAWTLNAAALCASSFAKRTRCMATLHLGPCGGLPTRYALRVLKRRYIPLLTSSTTVRRELRAAGLPVHHVAIMPPAIDPEMTGLVDRRIVRERWLQQAPIDDADFVLGLVGEPVNWPDAKMALSIAARIAVSGRKLKLVLHPEADRRVEAQRMAKALSLNDLIIVDDAAGEPWQCLAGLDAALLLGQSRLGRPAPSIMPLLWSLAAGVPAVVTVSDQARDLIDDQTSGMLVAPGDVNGASESIAGLYDDREMARRVGEAGRQVIADLFNIDAFCLRLRHTYELLLADRAVRTIEEEFAAIQPSQQHIGASL